MWEVEQLRKLLERVEERKSTPEEFAVLKYIMSIGYRCLVDMIEDFESRCKPNGD